MANVQNNKLYQILSVVALIGSLYLIWRGLQDSASARTSNPSLSASPVGASTQSNSTACARLYECCCAAISVNPQISPLAADYTCCGTQATDLQCCCTHAISRRNTGQPIILGTFAEACGQFSCCKNATSTAIPVTKTTPVSNKNIAVCL